MHLISADAAGFDGKRDRWLPELAKQLVRSFTSATARNAAAAQKLSKLGLASGKITVQRRLKPTGRLLPCQSSDLDDLSGQLQGRPVWLAAQVQPQEVNSVLMAHGSALRSAHRLLLVLEPADATNLNELIRALEEAGLTHATWGDGAWPEENTQVLIADLPGELGLWYRISTVSFLGSSLQSGLGGCDPLSAAALGTAILYGPNVRHHLQSYTRLANAGAARIVNDGESLGTAVSHLIAPDQAATMAHAGWDIISEGAEIIDGIIDLVQETLDSRQPELSAP